MRIERKVIAVMMILAMYLSFASCDDEFVEDPNSTEDVDPIDDENTDDDSTASDTTNGTKDENRAVIENKVFNETLIIDGHDNDSLIIRNCTFENISSFGLLIKNVDELIVKDCIFRNIGNSAINLGVNEVSTNVTIDNNEIYDVVQNGIMVFQTHIRPIITNNKIYDVATYPDGGPHGIYCRGRDFIIEGNTIHNVGVAGDHGSGISVRTYGTVRGNKVYAAQRNGISYSSDRAGYDGTLLVENNVVYDNMKRGINIYSGPNESKIGKAIIRFNTVISTNDHEPIFVDSGYYPDATFEVYGNVLLNLGTASRFAFASSSHPFEVESHNLTSNADIGFVNLTNRDLHILSDSEANDYAIGVLDFPKSDIDNAIDRIENSLDAGACSVD